MRRSKRQSNAPTTTIQIQIQFNSVDWNTFYYFHLFVDSFFHSISVQLLLLLVLAVVVRAYVDSRNDSRPVNVVLLFIFMCNMKYFICVAHLKMTAEGRSPTFFSLS